MKLTDDARHQGVSYRTAWRWWKAGTLPGHQMDTGTMRSEAEPPTASSTRQRAAIYARVSSAAQRNTGAPWTARQTDVPPPAPHGGIRWRRWSQRSGLASMMGARRC
jgi:hypothetical protein